MTRLFLDSSALVKLFVLEAGSNSMIDLMERGEDQSISTSVLAVLEVRSAIRRRQYAKDIADADADQAIYGLLEETKRVVEHPVTAAVLLRASTLVDRHNLRSLDSVQLSTALIADERYGANDLTFVASDRRLLRAARDEGLSVWDPCVPGPTGSR